MTNEKDASFHGVRMSAHVIVSVKGGRAADEQSLDIVLRAESEDGGVKYGMEENMGDFTSCAQRLVQTLDEDALVRSSGVAMPYGYALIRDPNAPAVPAGMRLVKKVRQ